MAVVNKTDEPVKMTFDAFLAWSEGQEGKWELHDGIPVRKHDPAKGHAERIEHIDVKYETALSLRKAITKAGTNYRVVGDGATVQIDDEVSYEPDALVYCGERLKKGTIIIADPVIIVEVLSPSTAWLDVSTKLEDYFKLPSVQHYLIIDPRRESIQHHYRDGEQIRLDPVESETLKLDPPGLTLPVRELFA